MSCNQLCSPCWCWCWCWCCGSRLSHGALSTKMCRMSAQMNARILVKFKSCGNFSYRCGAEAIKSSKSTNTRSVFCECATLGVQSFLAQRSKAPPPHPLRAASSPTVLLFYFVRFHPLSASLLRSFSLSLFFAHTRAHIHLPHCMRHHCLVSTSTELRLIVLRCMCMCSSRMLYKLWP